VTERELGKGGPTARADAVVIRDRIADSMFQQMLLRPSEYSVIATPTNGDYLSDAAAAQVGGLASRRGNVGTALAVFEATHERAQICESRQDQSWQCHPFRRDDVSNHGWNEAANLIIRGVENAHQEQAVTYDLARHDAGRDGSVDVCVCDQVIAGMKS